MKSSLPPACLLLAFQVIGAQICQPPKSESMIYLTSSMTDNFVAQDYDLGRLLTVFSADLRGHSWSFTDLVTGITYTNSTEGGCRYSRHTAEQYEIFEQCLSYDAFLQKSGDVDFYIMSRLGFTWLVGMKPVPGTYYYYRHFSRVFEDNFFGRNNTYGMTYRFSEGISDPTIFDKDFSSCVEVPVESTALVNAELFSPSYI